jgi:hypothetical protein
MEALDSARLFGFGFGSYYRLIRPVNLKVSSA